MAEREKLELCSKFSIIEMSHVNRNRRCVSGKTVSSKNGSEILLNKSRAKKLCF